MKSIGIRFGAMAALVISLAGLSWSADKKPVPSTPAQVLGVPATPPPTNVSSPRSEIEQAWDSGKRNQAQKLLDNWKGKEKNSPWPWVVSARMRHDEKKFKKSISESQAALQKSPECGEAYYWRGRSYEAMKKYLEAVNEYRAAIIAKDSFPEAKKDWDRVQAVLGPIPEKLSDQQPVVPTQGYDPEKEKEDQSRYPDELSPAIQSQKPY